MPQLRTLILSGLAASLFATSSIADADEKSKPYTMADLKALVAQKAYQEAIVHLTDIAPAERNAEWVDLGATAAGGFLAGLKGDKLHDGLMIIEMIDGALPAIAKSPKYTKPRATVGLKAITTCFDSQSWGGADHCVEAAIKLVDGDPTNHELALGVAKEARRGMTAHAAAQFYKRAFASAGNATGAICKSEDFQLVITSGLGLPSDYDNAKVVRELLGGACWGELSKRLFSDFDKAGETSYERRNMCKLFRDKKALTKTHEHACRKAEAE